ncbi:hypothetical protein ASF43_28175 [Pseudorhodoferax sp. Leaf267]|nr:hypothetical protein ASF43_28175 [Pseudorhodoferax sp. Leaf267]
MPYYSVSRKAEADGEHLVHARGCAHYPNELNAQGLGWHVYCSTAVKAAAEFFLQVNGCEVCCWPCHKEHGHS